MADPVFRLEGKRIWVAGHRGMVGSAVVRRLASTKCQVLTVDRKTVDLRRQADVEAWMTANKPQVVFLAAATVGGIHANDSRPAEFLYDNIALETNIIHTARTVGVERLIFLSSACVYPKMAPQPIPEEALLSGPLEPTNEWYAVAKIAGLKLCEAYRRQYGCDFVGVQPNNLYGPGDNFDLTSSHVIPALMAKAHRAKVESDAEFEVWGSGKPLREFLYVDDLADALVFIAERYAGTQHINVGTGEELSIRALAETVAATVGFKGKLRFNASMPDGTPRKLVDVSRLTKLGWTSKTDLKTGLALTYDWFKKNAA
jgi:GDP-L-fucose synthase